MDKSKIKSQAYFIGSHQRNVALLIAGGVISGALIGASILYLFLAARGQNSPDNPPRRRRKSKKKQPVSDSDSDTMA